jgi:hypothetical protein
MPFMFIGSLLEAMLWSRFGVSLQAAALARKIDGKKGR